MSSNIERHLLSSSLNGEPKIVQDPSISAGTAIKIHQTPAGINSIDSIHLWGHGITGSLNGNIRLLISPNGLQPTDDLYQVLLMTCSVSGEDSIINPGAFRLGGIYNLQDGAAIYAYVSSIGVQINVYGYVDRIFI
jgi:hypothetical protein